MLKWIVLLFIVVPLIELFLLLWVGSQVGFWPTLAIVVVTGMLGGYLAKREGLKVWRDWRRALEELRPPEQGVLDGVLVLVGGAFLIAPGMLTDAMGLAMMVPRVRKWVAVRVRREIDRRMADGRLRVAQSATIIDFGGDILRPQSVSRSDVIETTGEALPPKRDD